MVHYRQRFTSNLEIYREKHTGWVGRGFVVRFICLYVLLFVCMYLYIYIHLFISVIVVNCTLV